MTRRTDLYDATYSRFSEQVLAEVRQQAFGTDIGQTSWTTVDEYERFARDLRLAPGQHALEVACGSGGPARHLARTTGCRVTGLDSNGHGIATANRLAHESGLADRATFTIADANTRLPFADASFDALLCIDALNHLPDRAFVLREWRRILRPASRAVFTDPVVITGPVTHDELAQRSSIGSFLFVPSGVNERLIAESGLRLLHTEDSSDSAALIAGRWHRARESHHAALTQLEGPERFAGLQSFLRTVELLTSTRRLSRLTYLVESPAP